ncbi:MFS transporter [Amycolatopsis anabasis]|uniref:MFS transporter n=1 Tax=Amycolatopsis anabasis TaxID=1840409 RepID=UPI00131A85BC|nr:MFS transporter [Amycolatopsis anabasis]
MGIAKSRTLAAERTAVFVVFALNGAALGSWAPRVPAIAEQVHAAPGSLGLALLGASVGMLLAASASGRLLEWAGSRAVIVASTVLACVFLPLIGFAGSVVQLGLVLFGLGASVGVLDVGMNMAAVNVERRAGRAIMPTFHAGFSFGGLVGSAAAGLAATQHWSPGRQLVVAAAVTLLVLIAVIWALPGAKPAARTARAAEPGPALARRPVLWLLAAVALCSAIAEGASSDWSVLLLVTENGMSQGAAALAFSGFSLAMALARLAGTWLQRRFGATRALAVGAVAAGCGLVAAALLPFPVVGYAGFALAGAGLAASFPIALSMAGDAGKRADDSGGEREVAFVTAIAYTGFLAGPPMIGGVAQVTSLSVSFVVVGCIAALIAPAAVAASRARARESREAQLSRVC